MSKYILSILLLFSFAFSSDFAKKYNYETDYKIALEKAKLEKKDIIFVLVSDHCPWCDRLKEEVLSLEYTNEIVQKHYIPLFINGDRSKYPNHLNSYVIPTIHFVSFKDESIIETIIGFNANYRFYEIIEEKEEKSK